MTWNIKRDDGRWFGKLYRMSCDDIKAWWNTTWKMMENDMDYHVRWPWISWKMMEDDLENDARCPVIRSLSFKLIPANLRSLERLQTPSITPCYATTIVPCFTTRDQKLIYILWMNLFWHMEPISMIYFTRYFQMFEWIIRGNHQHIFR